MKQQTVEGMQNITLQEFSILAPIVHKDSESPEETLACIGALDDMLHTLRMEGILGCDTYTRTGRLRKTKNRITITSLIDSRVEALVNQIKDCRQA